MKSEVTKQKELRESCGNEEEEANKDKSERKGKSPYAFLPFFLTSLTCLEAHLKHWGSDLSIYLF